MARQTWVTNLRTFMKGMAKDILKELLPADKYFEAENVTVTSQQEGTAGGLTPALGTEFSVERDTIDIEDPADDYKGFRVKLDLSPGVVHAITYTIPSSAPVTINVSSGLFTASARYANLVSQINADAFLEVYITPTLTSQTEVFIGVRGYGSDFTLTETISAISTDVFVIKEFYGITHNGDFVLLKSLNIGDNLYQIETNGSVFKWSVAKHDRQADTWQYVTLLQTISIQIPVDAVIDLDGEINNGNKVSLYFTGEGVEPRVLYVQLQDTWVENSAMIYDETFPTIENEDGYFTYDNVSQITNVQVLENNAIAILQSVNNSGGAQKTGSKHYTVRQSIGTDNATGFYFYTDPIPIFLDGLSDPNLSGNVAGLTSTKSITLQISGLNPSVYDYFELVCIENNDGALSAYVVGQYPITGVTQTVTHTGLENTTSITFAEINIQQIVVKNAANLVITRNRLFLSNITLSQAPDLTEFAESIPIRIARTTIPAIGNTYSSVNEYQSPENVNMKTGYILYEVYRFAIIFFFNNNSPYRGVSKPYFIGDLRIDPDAFGIGNALTDNNGSGTPNNIYVYYPEFDIDLSTIVDGIPLSEMVYAYQIVRLPCIPEVLAMGLAMPASQAGEPTLTDYYTAGSTAAIGVAYSEGPTSSRRNQISAIFPDIQFRTTSISPLAGHKLFNFGQVYRYNSILDSSVSGQALYLFEYSSAVDGQSRVQHILTADGEQVNFNTDGAVEINGAKLRNTVSYTFPGIVPFVFGNNQTSLALPFNDFLNPLNGFTDYGLYLCQYVVEKSNKYGPKDEGNYVSTGHFRVVDPTVTSYTDEVFGGDAFTIKVFTKFCNYWSAEPTTPSATVSRSGISYYVQCRGNYQLRHFTAGSSGDYPYTTTDFADWLNVDEQLEGQLNYSQSYTPTTLIMPQSAYDIQAERSAVTIETSTIRYSQLKIENSLLDSYRQFLPLDFKAFPSLYGSIKNTFNFGNAIVVMMDRYIGVQQVDLQQQQTDPSNQTTIIIGDGTVLGAREQDISFIGAPIKTAGYSYLSKFGKKYFVWFNPDYKKVLQYSQNGIRDLFEENNMQSFLTLNTTYIKDERSFFFCYDYYTSELLMFTKAALDAGTVYDGEEQYTKGQIVFTEGGYTNTRYYIATQSVINNKSPENVGNLFLYWKPYRQSNFALAYNEQSNNITSFYSYTPQYPLMPYMNTFLSSPDSLLLSRNVYEHNRFTNKFYLDDIKAFVNSIVNDNDSITKQAINLQMNSNISPIALVFKSNSETVTYSEQSDIKRQRNLWWSVVKNDATVSANNPTGINSLMTAQINGEFIEVTIFLINNADQVNTLSSVAMTVVEKPPVISNR